MRQSALLPQPATRRRALPHQKPPWLDFDATYLLTICATPRWRDQLCRPPVPDEVRTWLDLHDERANWRWIACVVMPDHVHVLTTIAPTTSICSIVTPWKRYLARLHGVRWQRDFFEHRLRSQEHVQIKRDYLRQNPVRAGLVDKPEEWPYFWTA
jgi:REP element-mobilizing transposase RayT